MTVANVAPVKCLDSIKDGPYKKMMEELSKQVRRAEEWLGNHGRPDAVVSLRNVLIGDFWLGYRRNSDGQVEICTVLGCNLDSPADYRPIADFSGIDLTRAAAFIPELLSAANGPPWHYPGIEETLPIANAIEQKLAELSG